MKKCLICEKEIELEQLDCCSTKCINSMIEKLKNQKIITGNLEGKNGARGERIKASCVVCGNKFWARRSKDRTCSNQCFRELMKQTKLGRFINNACENCSAKQIVDGKQVCSFNKETIKCTKICPHCGESFEFKYEVRKRKTYCGMSCSRQANIEKYKQGAKNGKN